ncbi:hypothetical protein MTO96_011083 [Rhipicephalus appendiculatus]
MSLTDEELERLAREEILRETKRGAERAKDHGAYGWEKPRVHPTNKNFLKNTILSTLVAAQFTAEANRPVTSLSTTATKSRHRTDARIEGSLLIKVTGKGTHDGVQKKKQ